MGPDEGGGLGGGADATDVTGLTRVLVSMVRGATGAVCGANEIDSSRPVPLRLPSLARLPEQVQREADNQEGDAIQVLAAGAGSGWEREGEGEGGAEKKVEERGLEQMLPDECRYTRRYTPHVPLDSRGDALQGLCRSEGRALEGGAARWWLLLVAQLVQRSHTWEGRVEAHGGADGEKLQPAQVEACAQEAVAALAVVVRPSITLLLAVLLPEEEDGERALALRQGKVLATHEAKILKSPLYSDLTQ